MGRDQKLSLKRVVGLVLTVMILFSGCSESSRTEIPMADTPYLVDSIAMPQGLSGEVGALTFLPSGRLIAAFRRGEVMIYDPQSDQWTVFARGLHLPLGLLAQSENEVLVMQYAELTRLVDSDLDGEADIYENVTDDFGLGGNYHEFAYGPVKDDAGNLFIALNSTSNGGVMMEELRGELNEDGLTEKGLYSAVPYRGWVMRLDPNGDLQPFASGFRSPNGLGFDLEGRLWVTDNQGDWVGTSPLYHVQPDRFYGHPPSLAWSQNWPGGKPIDKGVGFLDSARTRAAVLFPHNVMANSPTEPVVIRNDDFGPFKGQLLVGEMNQERIVRVMVEEIGGQLQGASIPFLDGGGLRKGNNRLVFGPDGALWVGQNASGWAGSSGIQKIEFTGRTPVDVQTIHLTPEGFRLTFTTTMEESSIRNPANYSIRSYYYEYHEKYGSDQMDVKDIEVEDVLVAEGGKAVELSLYPMEKDRVYELRLNGFQSAGGDTLTNNLICYTINELVH